jgi:hypothetical protein
VLLFGSLPFLLLAWELDDLGFLPDSKTGRKPIYPSAAAAAHYRKAGAKG